MDSTTGSDPFLWNEDRLAEELSNPDTRWASALRRFPDTSKLAMKLRENEVDGEVLMTYEDAWGSPLFLHEFLQKSLEVTGMRQQMAVKSLVQSFKSGSPAYQRWKAEQDTQSQIKAEDPAIPLTATLASVPAHTPHKDIPHNDPDDPHPPRGTGSSAPACDAVQAAQGPSAKDGDATPRPPALSSENLIRKRTFDEMQGEDHPADDPLPEEPEKKKKRIVPAVASSVVNTNLVAQFLADETVEHVLRGGHSSQSYLGKVRMDPAEIFMPDPRPFDRPESFVFLPSKILPTGRRIQVHRALRHYLIPNDLVKIQRRRPEKDDILPVFGESDDELDEETSRQIEEDEAEDARIEARRLKAASKRLLSKDDVKATLEASIASLEQDWELGKLPKLARKANKIWHDSRLAGNHQLQIDRARADLERYSQRLAKLSDHISMENWTNKNDVERQCGVLEQTVQDRRYSRWLVEMLSSPVPPPAPSQLPRLRPRAKKTYDHLEEDEEILSSGSDADDFIDDSEQPQVGEETMGTPERVSTGMERPPSPSTPPSKVSPSDSSTRPHSSQGTSSGAGRTTKIIIRTPRHADKLKEAIVISSASPPTPPHVKVDKPLPDYGDIQGIQALGAQYWEASCDPMRLVVAVLCIDNWVHKRANLLEQINRHDAQFLWEKYILHLRPTLASTTETPASALTAKEQSFAFDLAKLFDAYLSCSITRLQRRLLRAVTIQRIQQSESAFVSLHAFLRSIAPSFSTSSGATALTDSRSDADSSNDEVHYAQNEDGAAEGRDNSTSSELGPTDQVILPEQLSLDSGGEEEDTVDTRSPGKKRRSKPRRNLAARNLRMRTFEHNAEMETRRQQLHENLAKYGTVPGDRSRLIINEAKKDNQGFIYIHDHISPYIKDHQVEGVRFMWNQVVVDSKAQQGCLLAHTMGLGKTMQVIALLVAIAQAAASEDQAISSQVPKHLRESRTLILCPSGLVNNWVDELLRWAPPDLLGSLRTVISTTDNNEQLIGEWASEGGVLVIGYAIFKKLVLQLELAPWLYEKPNIVIGDEAHTLKNPNSQVSKATQDFRTMARVAMTGSPLTNNVLDYYAMIDWVAPNYLADIDEFRREWANPIKEGLYADSSAAEKRRALKLLQALKETVGPKVHRMGPSTLKGHLPTKKEFILSLRLTEVQLKAYTAYIYGVVHDPSVSQLIDGNAKIWSLVTLLGTLLAHPAIFKSRLKERQNEARVTKSDDLVEFPPRFIHDLLATMIQRDLSDIRYSWKVVVLMRILDLSKQAGDKVLIFSQSIPTLDFLQNLFINCRINYSRLDGSTQTKLRQDQVKNFNSKDGPDVYLISTRAGGVGLNIFGANRVVIFDFRYTPAEEQQAVGRAYRMGQTKPVFVYWLTVGGTFEDTIQRRTVFKMQLASRVVDKKNPIALSKRLGDYFAYPVIPEQRNVDRFLNQDAVLDGLLRDTSLAGAIRNITSTDTFEEEEKLELTTEETEEAKVLIEQNRLRYQDLNEHQRQQREGGVQVQQQTQVSGSEVATGSAKPTMPPQAPAQPIIEPEASNILRGVASSLVPTSSSASAVAQPRPSAIPFFASRTDSSNPGMAGSRTSYASPLGSFLARPAAPPASQPPPPSHNQFPPILAPGTSYREVTQLPVTTGAASYGLDKEAQLVQILQPVYQTVRGSGLTAAQDPKRLVETLSAELQRQYSHTLERREFMVNLKQVLQNSHRFAAAVVCGQYPPAILASQKKHNLLELSTSWEQMNEASYLDLLKAQEQPDVGRHPQKRTEKRTGAEPTN
ncbi:hypothetical protein GQ53DRAFT_537219 [Thozetella sp. PMI_491]|nr:hypothetical protein GQ53DRAFT_537219 [Thozetella sp. PMI_491]